jgi:DNA polymerase I-like protein with 3'-5' exonuclease and polymerase domains
VIQGGAADVMKQKLVELHEARKSTGFLLRATIHDEVIGDAPDQESAALVHAILNRQTFPEVKIPLLWETGVGANWAETLNLESEFSQFEEQRAESGYKNTGDYKGGRNYRG